MLSTLRRCLASWLRPELTVPTSLKGPNTQAYARERRHRIADVHAELYRGPVAR